MEGTTILDVVKTVYQAGRKNYAQTILVNIFFGAFFGRRSDGHRPSPRR